MSPFFENHGSDVERLEICFYRSEIFFHKIAHEIVYI